MAMIMAMALTWPVRLPRVILGAQVGDVPEAGQDLFPAVVRWAECLGGLLDDWLLDRGAMLEQVGADTGPSFGVGGGGGVKAGGLGSVAVGHGSGKDQAGEGYLLIGDGVAGFVFGHRCLLQELRSMKNPA